MTDAEHRKELLDELRSAAFHRGPEFSVCDKAAEEIERLAEKVATWQEGCDVECKRAEKAERRINELLEFCEILRRERDEARSAADRRGK